MGPDILQLILISNVFILGAVSAVAIRAYLDHKHPKTHAGLVDVDVASRLSNDAEAALRSSLETASAVLSNDLNSTAKDIHRQLASSGSNILLKEQLTAVPHVTEDTSTGTTNVTVHSAVSLM